MVPRRPGKQRPGRLPRVQRLCAAAALAAALVPGSAPGQSAPEGVAKPAAAAAGAESPGPVALIEREAAIYWDDAKALFLAPLRWNGRQIGTAVGAGALVGGVMIFDERSATWVQDHASAATNGMSKAVSPFGAWAAFAASGALVASGALLHDGRVTSMGREGIEACLFATLIANVLKPVFGRERPYVSGNESVFEPFTHNYSFPSGHATVAFALASVVSARSDGWIIPTASYTLASLVAYSRVNDAQHFPADVVAGGLIGAAVGRFIVHRHQRAEAGAAPPKVAIEVFPMRNGLGVSARF